MHEESKTIKLHRSISPWITMNQDNETKQQKSFGTPMTNVIRIKSRRMSLACSTQGGRREMHIGFWWESQKERD
jgi:hypothetical protein